MTDLGYVFTIYFITLGPLKTIPAFFMATRHADWRTVVSIAVRSALVATLVALFVGLVVSGVLVTWRVSIDALAIAGGIVLLITSVRTLSSFTLTDTPVGSEQMAENEPPPVSTRWMGRPILSPLAIPAIVSPIGVVAILYFSGVAAGDTALQAQLVGLLLCIMAANFLAMLCAGPIMRVVGLPVLQIVGWVFSALQAGLAVQIMITALGRLP